MQVTRVGVGGPGRAYGVFADKASADAVIKAITRAGVGGPGRAYKAFADKAPSSGSAVAGTINYTNADDTASITGTSTVIGVVAATNANDSVSITGFLKAVGSVAVTNAGDIVSISGTATVGKATGVISYTNAGDTVAISGYSKVVGAVAITNKNDSVSIYGIVNNGIIVEAALTTGISQPNQIKKPGIPVDAPAWLKTFLETIVGRRGNKITPPAFQDLQFSATPTKAECEALYSYANQIRTAVNDIITRLDS